MKKIWRGIVKLDKQQHSVKYFLKNCLVIKIYPYVSDHLYAPDLIKAFIDRAGNPQEISGMMLRNRQVDFQGSFSPIQKGLS